MILLKNFMIFIKSKPAPSALDDHHEQHLLESAMKINVLK